MGRTSLQVSEELADELFDRKVAKGRGATYEDVIWELLEKADAYDEMQGDQGESS